VRLNDKTFVGSGKSIFIVFGSSNSVKSDHQQPKSRDSESVYLSQNSVVPPRMLNDFQIDKQGSDKEEEVEEEQRRGTYPSVPSIEQLTF